MTARDPVALDCDLCPEDADDTCGQCGEPFDGYAIHYTTVQCLGCGRVYQEEYRVCEKCRRRNHDGA